MGFYFRKSINLGLFRLNFSKSGIGASAGIKGARVSTNSHGTYIHIGKNGFYYKQKIAGLNEQFETHNFESANTNESSSDYNARAHDFVDITNTELIKQINSKLEKSAFNILLITATSTLLLALFFILPSLLLLISTKSIIPLIIGFLLSVTTLLIGSYIFWDVYRRNKKERTTSLTYELNGALLMRFTDVQKACDLLSKSSIIRGARRDFPAFRHSFDDLNYYELFGCVREQPPYISTNIPVWCLESNNFSLYFLPDYVFVWQNKKYFVITYESLSVKFSTTHKVSNGIVPLDAETSGGVWEHSRKDGGRDLRYKSNRYFPIVIYGQLKMRSQSGFELLLYLSNWRLANEFAEIFSRINPKAKQSENKKSSSQDNRSNSNYNRQHTNTKTNYSDESKTTNNHNQTKENIPVIDKNVRFAYEVLEIKIGATKEQITTAYRRMARIYHPDKSNHSNPATTKKAEEKMKQINVAYQTLKKHKHV